VRHAAARGEPVPEELEAWVAKVREHAYTATDADVDALRAAGYSEDQIFEATVAAAVGAGLARFDAGVAALR
jgi:alkylhydroperoxidase family enzyme